VALLEGPGEAVALIRGFQADPPSPPEALSVTASPEFLPNILIDSR